MLEEAGERSENGDEGRISLRYNQTGGTWRKPELLYIESKSLLPNQNSEHFLQARRLATFKSASCDQISKISPPGPERPGVCQERVQAPTSNPSLRLQTSQPMATLTLQRASWCLQISRTSRTFAVSFTTALPRKGKPRHLPQDFSSAWRESSNPLRSSKENPTGRSSRHAESRRAFTSTRVYHAQQEAASPASRPTSLDAQPRPPPETISPDTPDLTAGLNDQTFTLDEGTRQIDWTRSFHGLSTEAFSPEAAKALLAPIEPDEIEVKPDGIIYLPEIKYRRILNQAFGPGGWGLAPRGETIVTAKAVTREYALVALGRYVANVTFFSTDRRRKSTDKSHLQARIRRPRRTRLLLP